MVAYRDYRASSGVAAYCIGDGYIIVKFRDDGTYLYDSKAPGPAHVEEMIRRARAGSGLATYINKEVRGNFARKIAD